VAEQAPRLADPTSFVILSLLVVAIPLWRRRWCTAVAVVGLIVASNLTTQVLQSATADTRLAFVLPYAQWPSGHVTAIVSVALGLVLGVPRAARGYAVVAAIALTFVLGWAVVAGHMHLPSDVFGAVFVTGAWAGLIAAALLRDGHVSSSLP
jgi:membrane-associated phospholipid phosphatase